LSKSGVVNTNFFNNGPTYTNGGHVSITTGNYQEIDNTGKEIPAFPSFFRYWNEKYALSRESSWIISSKSKLEVFNNCLHTEFFNRYMPLTNCGTGGLESANRTDSATFTTATEILSNYHPGIVIISFSETDYFAHAKNWDKYIESIRKTDEYIYELWRYILSDSNYKGKTTIFITNDHGRHIDTVSNGYVSHGDGCLGCRHLNFFAYGPDFKEDTIIVRVRELVDISATISELLQLNMPYGQGEVMHELFK
jgi:hypothetical protein